MCTFFMPVPTPHRGPATRMGTGQHLRIGHNLQASFLFCVFIFLAALGFLKLQLVGLVAPRHVESFWIKDGTRVSPELAGGFSTTEPTAKSNVASNGPCLLVSSKTFLWELLGSPYSQQSSAQEFTPFLAPSSL